MRSCGLLCCVLLVLFYGKGQCQSAEPSNVILVTLDGFRWQELFRGADSVLIFNREASPDRKVVGSYWDPKPGTRRKSLMPFIWSEVAGRGQLLGNRMYGNKVDCENPHWFSYPGYNEMLTGFVDSRIRSNDTVDNPNMTVFEFIGNQTGFEGKAAAFATWQVFPHIFREITSGITVNAGHDNVSDTPTAREELLNELQEIMQNEVTDRHDVFTMYYAMEYMKKEHPRALFIGLDEMDAYAHGGRYDQYLNAVNRADALIAKLWSFVQNDTFYQGNTTLIVTTDHGRGRGYTGNKLNWRSHGRLAFGSGEVWLAAIGPQVPALGEVCSPDKITLSQVAATVANVIGITYTNTRKVAEGIESILAPRSLNEVEKVASKD